MTINSINSPFHPIPNVHDISKTKPSTGSASGTQSSTFGDVLADALKEVNTLQNEADQQIEGVTLKKEGVTPHSAMVALEKADIAFQLMSAVRSKIIRAYEEVIRTQV